MILIEEKKASKIPGGKSLFISFNYNVDIVATIKTCDVANYDKKTRTWEVPVTNLSSLLDRLVMIDEIQLNLLQDEKKEETNNRITSTLKTTPYPYQKEGIEYGINHDKFLLLDAPGLGKTLQVIYTAQELKKTEGLEHCLIICGVNTLKNNWKREIQKHSDLSCRILGEKVSSRGNISIGSVAERLDQLKHPIEEFFIITNIETLRNNDIAKEINKGKANVFDMIVVDECHKCKNSQSQQGKNLLKLKTAKHRIGLSGTLLVNKPLDCYVPLKWIGVESCPGKNFEYYYCNYGGPFGHDLLGYKNMNVLKDIIEANSLRRTKDLLDLPEKNIIHEFVDMESTQASFYSDVADGIASQVDKVQLNTTSILAMTSRLRQATSCPSYLTTEDIPSAKADRAVDLIEQIIDSGSKVVVYSMFKETLSVLNEKITHRKPLLCTGDVKDTIIADNINNFQTNDDCKIMLATCQKMGTGITLTAATYAIFIDCPWTQADCLQCEDRIHRIGSKEPVFIYYLWTTGTIDEKVKDIVETKGILSDYVIDDTYQPQFLEKLKAIIDEL